MATTSTRSIRVGFTGDVEAPDLEFDAASNGASPAGSVIQNLASGANTITKPAGGSTVVGVTIIPPVGNTNLITLKGVTGDTGIPLHLTDPTSIALDSTAATFCLTAAGTIAGVRLIWS